MMELLEGETLASLLERGARLDIRRCASILEPVCGALQVAHDQGIVHRDVKPENVFLHRGSGGEVVKVVDFGIAALLQTTEAATLANKLTGTNVVMGTPAYVAPERVLGDAFDGRADVYSVGVMAYEMLTGTLPIEHDGRSVGLAAFVKQATGRVHPLRERLPDVGAEIEMLVMRALAREPTERPSAMQFADELKRLATASHRATPSASA